MKKLLENLLVASAVLLCVLCAYQWNRESHLRAEIKDLRDTLDAKVQAITVLTNSNARLEEQTAALTTRLTSLENTNREQSRLLFVLENNFKKAEEKIAKLDTNNFVLRAAVDDRNEKLKDQQEKLRQAMTERNEFARKQNEIVGKHNEVVKKYNELVEKYEQLMTNYLAKAAEPAPAEKKK